MDRRRVIPIFVTVFTNILGAGVILPILPIYAEGNFGASAFQATLLNAAYFAAQFLAAPWLGRLSDRVGRRPVLIFSQIGTVFSFVLFIFALPIGVALDRAGLTLGISGGLFMLYVARILDGLTGGNISTAQAYMSDISTPQTRAQALGLISAAFGLGFIFGPAFGGILAQYNLVAPFVGAAVITSLSVLLTMILLEESLPPEKREEAMAARSRRSPGREFLRNRTILLILGLSASIVLAFSALQSTFALYAQATLFSDLPDSLVARNVGGILAFVGMVSVLTQLVLIKPLVQRFGEQRLILFGQVGLFIGLLGVGLSTTPWLVTLFIAPVAFSQGINQPSLQSLITRFGTDKSRGQLLGLIQSANSLGFILGPVWAGLAFDYISPRAPYLIGAMMMFVTFGLALLLLRRDIPMAAARPGPGTPPGSEGTRP